MIGIAELCIELRDNARKDMAGRIYAALLAKRVTMDQQDALLEEAVRSTDALLMKLSRHQR
jgi:hypothetical protein